MSFEPKNYLLTGAAGFIASRVAHQLLQQGHRILAVDNLNDAYDPRLKHHRLRPLLQHPNFTFIQADIAGFTPDNPHPPFSEALAAFGTIAAIFNLAARAGVPVSVQNPWLYLNTNTTGTLNLLHLAVQHRIPKFILASTSSLYGNHNPLPYAETANTDRPLSPYAATKKAAEALASTYHHLYGLDVSILRYFTVYGPAGRPDMSIFRFARWIIEGQPIQITGDGSQSRDFTYVDDIARGTILAAQPLGCEIINLGSDSPYTLNQMIALLEQHTGKQARLEYLPAPHTDVNATWADISKAKTLLGWQPTTPFSLGLQNLVEWYIQNRPLASSIDLPKLF